MNPHRLGNKNSKEKTRPKSTGILFNYIKQFLSKYFFQNVI